MGVLRGIVSVNHQHWVQLTTFAKAKVEAGVQVAQRWIVAALRHTQFSALADLNEAIAPLLDRLNRRPFRKRLDACRASLFEQLDRPALRPLPRERYVLAQWRKVRPNIDYHVGRSSGTITVCRINWWARNWRLATRPPPSKSSIMACASPLTAAGWLRMPRPRFTTTVPRAIAPTWSGLRRG
jgi:hypothetical protein